MQIDPQSFLISLTACDQNLILCMWARSHAKIIIVRGIVSFSKRHIPVNDLHIH